jgi:hypothetical protein
MKSYMERHLPIYKQKDVIGSIKWNNQGQKNEKKKTFLFCYIKNLFQNSMQIDTFQMTLQKS